MEGIRTDVKLVNTSLFATDWYIDQMKRKTYDADPIPTSLEHDQYKYGTLDVAYYYPLPQFKDTVVTIDYFMKWIGSNNEVTYYEGENGVKEKVYPTNHIRIPVNKANVLKSGIVKAKDADKIVDHIDITISDRAITKNTILMLDILANFDWKKPIYFTGGSNDDNEYIWLKDYMQLDGMAYKLVPILTPNRYQTPDGKVRQKSLFDMGRIDPEKMYENVKKWNFRNINDGKIYLDEQTKRNAISMRNNLMRLSEEFLKQGDSVRANDVLDLSLHKMPIKDFDHYSISLGYPELYYRIGDIDKARETAETLIDIFKQKLKYYSTFKGKSAELIFDNLDTYLYMYRSIIDDVQRYDKDSDFLQKLQNGFIDNVKLFDHLLPDDQKPQPQTIQLDTIKP